MEHGQKNRKFGREIKPRGALLKSLAVALVNHGKIKTTEAKAKSLRTFIEKLATKTKNSDLAAKRLIFSSLGVKSGNRFLKEVMPRIHANSGGITRISKFNQRIGDNADMAIIEFIDKE